jgi:hypothetical protein
MSEVQVDKSDAQKQDEAKAQKVFNDPYEYLATFPNAPNKNTIELMRAQTPNGIIRIFAPGKRVFLVRGLSGMELQGIQAQIPSNLGAGLADEAKAAKIEAEVALHAAAKGVIWTSITTDGKITADQLRAGSAGLPSTLFNLITYLSDFFDPQALELLSTEL